MSIENELQRISEARDKIREQLLRIYPTLGSPEDVISASQLSIEANDDDDTEVTNISSDGTGSCGAFGAKITVRATLDSGYYKFSFNSSEQLGTVVSVSDGNGHSETIGSSDFGSLLTYNVYESFAKGVGLNVGDDIIFIFSIPSVGSNSNFSITVEHIVAYVMPNVSKLDECALALEAYADHLLQNG